MNHVLTDAQRLFFETNGYLAIPKALSSAELKAVRKAADRAESIWRSDLTRLGWRRENIQQVQAIIEYDDIFLDLMEHPKVFPLIKELVGRDIQMIDNDYFITPAYNKSHANWHHDVGMPGVYHPRSTMMIKAFFLLSDVSENSGCTLYLPGSHRYPTDFRLPKVDNPVDMPNHAKMAYPAGTAYFFNGRTYHAAAHNDSDVDRRVIIFNYGHFWMKMWQGYEPSEKLKAKAATAVRKQLLGIGPAYGTYLPE